VSQILCFVFFVLFCFIVLLSSLTVWMVSSSRSLPLDWRKTDVSPSSSAVSIQKYLDACEKFLVTPAKEGDTQGGEGGDFPLQNRLPSSRRESPIPSRLCIGIHERDTSFSGCHSCGSSEGRSLTQVANPFTRAPFLVLCEACSRR